MAHGAKATRSAAPAFHDGIDDSPRGGSCVHAGVTAAGRRSHELPRFRVASGAGTREQAGVHRLKEARVLHRAAKAYNPKYRNTRFTQV
jgi:hypothetical protein